MKLKHTDINVNKKNKKNTQVIKNKRNLVQKFLYFFTRNNILTRLHKFTYQYYRSGNVYRVLEYIIRQCSSPNRNFMPDGKLWFWNTQQKIADDLGLCSKTIYRILKHLEKLGFIASDQLMKKSRGILTKSYRVCTNIIQKILGLSSIDIMTEINRTENKNTASVDNYRLEEGYMDTLTASDHLRSTALKINNKNMVGSKESGQRSPSAAKHFSEIIPKWLRT